jgi:hypothetical protein
MSWATHRTVFHLCAGDSVLSLASGPVVLLFVTKSGSYAELTGPAVTHSMCSCVEWK